MSKFRKLVEAIVNNVEIQPDMFGGKNELYLDGHRAHSFNDINEFMYASFPKLDLVDTGEANGKSFLVYEPASGGLKYITNAKKALMSKFEDIVVRVGQSQYAPELKKLVVQYIDADDINEDMEESVLSEGWFTPDLADYSSEDLAHEYFVYLFMKCFNKPYDTNTFERIKRALIKRDKSFGKLNTYLEKIADSVKDPDLKTDQIKAVLIKNGASEEILDKAYQAFVDEELGNEAA
jgi:hypothetical protein